MPVTMKTLPIRYSGMVLNALDELEQENKSNASVNCSLPARIMATEIRHTKELVKSGIEFSEQMMDSTFTIVALTDAMQATVEMAIVEFAWTVYRNFSEGQHFRTQCEEMVAAFDAAKWRNP